MEYEAVMHTRMDKDNEEAKHPYNQKTCPSYSLLYSKVYTNYAKDPFEVPDKSDIYKAFTFP